MKNAYGRADGDVLTGVERAAPTGRRITARRARAQKRKPRSSRLWSVGPLTVSPLVAAGVLIVLLAGAAGAAIVVTNGSSKPKASGAETVIGGASSSTTRPPTSHTPTTHLPAKAVAPVKGIYIRFADAGRSMHYMYCTQARGCGLLEVAKGGSSTVVAVLSAGVWHRVKRDVLRHDPCINIVQNGVRVGKAGDFAMVVTTDLRPTGTKTIKGIRVPARVAGTIAVHYEIPEQAGCTFSGTPDVARTVESPVTEYVPA
jgi:hypothetical protein